MIFAIFQTSGVTWLCPISMLPVLAIMKWDLGGATILVKNRWNRSRFSWIFSKFLTFILHTFVFTQMRPSPSPVFRATRILEHWNDCNTLINIEEGETHTRVTSIVVIISRGVVPGVLPDVCACAAKFLRTAPVPDKKRWICDPVPDNNFKNRKPFSGSKKCAHYGLRKKNSQDDDKSIVSQQSLIKNNQEVWGKTRSCPRVKLK